MAFGLAFALVLFVIAAFAPPADVLVVLALLALLVVGELFGRGLSDQERVRWQYLVGIGILAFAIIVIKRIAEILNAN